MKTTLTADGLVGIPAEVRKADHLAAGDSFELERLAPGHYVLAKQQSPGAHFTVTEADNGLPLIRAADGIITSHLVKELERQTP